MFARLGLTCGCLWALQHCGRTSEADLPVFRDVTLNTRCGFGALQKVIRVLCLGLLFQMLRLINLRLLGVGKGITLLFVGDLG